MTAGVVGVGVAAAVARETRLARRYAANPDPCEGRLFWFPEGSEFEVAATRGATLYGRRAGRGRPVVLVHGWLEHHAIWGAVAHRLVDAGFEVIAYDQRGHGRSTRGDAGGAAIEWLGDDLGEVLTQLDLHEAIVVGHSMGGMAAQACLGRRRDDGRAAATVLVATSHRRSRPIVRAPAAVFGPLAEWYLAPPTRGPVRIAAICGPTPVLAHAQGIREFLLATDRAVRLEWHLAMEQMSLADYASAITQPTHILAGSHDPLTPATRSRELAALIPHATLEVLEGRGHQLMWEAPDEVAGAVQKLDAAIGR